jgi:hypothetical protein
VFVEEDRSSGLEVMDINAGPGWLTDLAENGPLVDGLVSVADYQPKNNPPDEVLVMERARDYGAQYVFFEASKNGKPQVAQAFIFIAKSREEDAAFAETHKKLWSWGGVPLLYRKLPGIVQLFRCAHGPDFVKRGKIVCNPVRTLALAAAVSQHDAWWDAQQLRNGTLWDDTHACNTLLSKKRSAHKGLIDAVRRLSATLDEQDVLPRKLRRKLLILSLLIAYLEQREVFKDGYFARFLPDANEFFQVLASGEALVSLLSALESRFNGHVFCLKDSDRDVLRTSAELSQFSTLIEGREEENGQLTLWKLYSFKDLPVELISHIYQLFVKNADSSVYTPPYLVRLMLSEVLDWDRLDRLHQRNEVIFDPACGSGVFLVEAYKRLVLHWRSRNDWAKPNIPVLKGLLNKVCGVDLEEGAVELASFSLCLALCDALEPEEIRSSIKLFPQLDGKTIVNKCFFEAKEQKLVPGKIGVIVGNPPFSSSLGTPGAERSYEAYGKNIGALPDKQLAYLFLHEAMDLLTEGGVLCMLQQYNFLYNQKSLNFRRNFMRKWDVREILDLISVRGLFHKGGADTKIVVVVAEASKPTADSQILHATFRRSGRADAELGFDIDYYDMHWLPLQLALENDAVWRANLLGGGRSLSFVNRLSQLRTLKTYAKAQAWDFGEGFIEGKTVQRQKAEHITGKRYLPSIALTPDGVDETQITVNEAEHFRSAYSPSRYTPPMILFRAHMDLDYSLWTMSYLTYSQRIIGFAAPKDDLPKLEHIKEWIAKNKQALQAYVALISPGLFIQKATALQADDIFSLPYPEDFDLDLSKNEEIVAEDIVKYYRELVRLGDESDAMSQALPETFTDFNKVYLDQVNTIYRRKPLISLGRYQWPGVVCQAYCFGEGAVEWDGAEGLRHKLNALLHEQNSETLNVTRISRLYDGNHIFLIKPDQMRFWLRSIALRDADETLAELRLQGF